MNFNRVFHYFHHPFWWFSPYFWKHPNMTFEKMCTLQFIRVSWIHKLRTCGTIIHIIFPGNQEFHDSDTTWHPEQLTSPPENPQDTTSIIITTISLEEIYSVMVWKNNESSRKFHAVHPVLRWSAQCDLRLGLRLPTDWLSSTPHQHLDRSKLHNISKVLDSSYIYIYGQRPHQDLPISFFNGIYGIKCIFYKTGKRFAV